MTQEITQAIEELVGQINNSLDGTYDALLGHTKVCNTKYARVGKSVTQGTETYVMTDVVTDEYIIANDVDGLFYLPQPYFVNGTRISANREWTIAENDLTKKTPLIWLLDDISYIVYGRENPIDWDASIRMFFVDETDPTNYYNKDHIENVVLPMSKLMELFIDVVNSNRQYETLTQYSVRNFTRFGAEDGKGYIQNILDANLSGIELSINLKKYKQNCKC